MWVSRCQSSQRIKGHRSRSESWPDLDQGQCFLVSIVTKTWHPEYVIRPSLRLNCNLRLSTLNSKYILMTVQDRHIVSIWKVNRKSAVYVIHRIMTLLLTLGDPKSLTTLTIIGYVTPNYCLLFDFYHPSVLIGLNMLCRHTKFEDYSFTLREMRNISVGNLQYWISCLKFNIRRPMAYWYIHWLLPNDNGT